MAWLAKDLRHYPKEGQKGKINGTCGAVEKVCIYAPKLSFPQHV